MSDGYTTEQPNFLGRRRLIQAAAVGAITSITGPRERNGDLEISKPESYFGPSDIFFLPEVASHYSEPNAAKVPGIGINLAKILDPEVFNRRVIKGVPFRFMRLRMIPRLVRVGNETSDVDPFDDYDESWGWSLDGIAGNRFFPDIQLGGTDVVRLASIQASVRADTFGKNGFPQDKAGSHIVLPIISEMEQPQADHLLQEYGDGIVVSKPLSLYKEGEYQKVLTAHCQVGGFYPVLKDGFISGADDTSYYWQFNSDITEPMNSFPNDFDSPTFLAPGLKQRA